MRRNYARSKQKAYTTEYVHLPALPHVLKVTAEPLKTVYINRDAAWWATSEQIIKNENDPLLGRLMKGACI